MTDRWYRFEDVQYASLVDEFDNPVGTGRLDVVMRQYKVIKLTPKGVWLCEVIGDFMSPDQRFVRRTARKRFACPTIEEATESFIARKQRQAKILTSQARRALRAIDIIKKAPIVKLV